MTEEHLATFVDVILPLHLEATYTYRVPKDWEDAIAIGKRVVIQFGSRKIYSAIIAKIHHQPPKGYEAKYLYGVLDEKPILEEHHLKFWEWVSTYYLCTLGDVMQAALPSGLKLESATRIEANENFDPNSTTLDDKEYLIWEALELQHELTLQEVSDIVRLKNVFPLLKSMVAKGMVRIREELEEKYRQKMLTCIRLMPAYENETALASLFDSLEKQPKQLQVLMAYLQLQQQGALIDKTTLLKTAGGSGSPLQTLIKKEVFEAYEISVDRLQLDQIDKALFELNPAQLAAVDTIHQQLADKDILLLQGVTGSGKTHVYVKLMEQALQEGKQVLFLLPEIALTSQIIKRIRKYFGEHCISYHSKYNDQERVEIWNKVKEGTYKIVIGARSSLFLPFKELGLVIVDEEHENSYKQQDPAPRYHARDAAMVLAKMHGCKTILGSATPSLEVYFMAQQEKYAWVKMDKRYHEVDLPNIKMANLTEERRTKQMLKEDIGLTLHTAIEKALNQNEQIILFQNRRGYAPFLSCTNCEWVPKCKNCDISLTYHKYIDSLKCHYCGYIMGMPKSCTACGSPKMVLKGTGTEKIEDELSELYTKARIARLDLDAAKSKHGHEEIIRSFEERQFDILVGTQMVSKGLDFEHVSLVGVINADSLLQFPDFRAHERAMQMLLQVSGRAGRKHGQGEVIIQTTMPNHYVLQLLQQHKYEPLLERELEERQKFAYPPFFRLIKLVVKHREYRIAEEASQKLKNLLDQEVQAIIMGPSSPYVSKIRNFYIKEILLKVNRNSPHLPALKLQVKKCIKKLQEDKIFKTAIVYADVDPS